MTLSVKTFFFFFVFFWLPSMTSSVVVGLGLILDTFLINSLGCFVADLVEHIPQTYATRVWVLLMSYAQCHSPLSLSFTACLHKRPKYYNKWNSNPYEVGLCLSLSLYVLLGFTTLPVYYTLVLVLPCSFIHKMQKKKKLLLCPYFFLFYLFKHPNNLPLNYCV